MVRLTDHPDMTLDVYRGRKTTMQCNEGYQSCRADTISILKITKGNYSAKNVGGVTVVYLCTSSGHALYFYQVL